MVYYSTIWDHREVCLLPVHPSVWTNLLRAAPKDRVDTRILQHQGPKYPSMGYIYMYIYGFYTSNRHTDLENGYLDA